MITLIYKMWTKAQCNAINPQHWIVNPETRYRLQQERDQFHFATGCDELYGMPVYYNETLLDGDVELVGEYGHVYLCDEMIFLNAPS